MERSWIRLAPPAANCPSQQRLVICISRSVCSRKVAEELRHLRSRHQDALRKQLQLRLHQRQRRAQLVGSVAGELPLGGKGVVQPPSIWLNERLSCRTETASSSILISARLFSCTCPPAGAKAAKGLRARPLTKIGEDAAEQRYRRCDVPVGGARSALRPIDDDGQLLVGRYELRVKALAPPSFRIAAAA